MSLITELIERLRTEADGYKGYRSKRAVRVKHLLREAADTIEQLAAKVRAENGDGWIPIKTRELTEEEKKHFEEQLEMGVNEIICSPLPEDGQEVLITMYDRVYLDTFCDDWYGSSFENADIEDVKAWKPLPEPYREDGNNA